METDFETFQLRVRDYISPECTCKLEDMVNAVPHVVEVSFDQVSNILKVKVHRGMASAEDIIKELKKCSVFCELRMPTHEMAHMEHEAEAAKKKGEMPAGHEMRGMGHEAMKMVKPSTHDHHGMMATE